MSLSEPIAEELRREAATTRRMLERVPEEKLAWRPHEKSMTLTQDEVDFAAGNYQPFVAPNVAELLEKFDRNVAGAVEALQGQADDEHLLKAWRLKRNGQVLFEMPRLAVLRSMGLNHVIHHRGQLSVYLRLLDVPLPSVYGPTADEAIS